MIDYNMLASVEQVLAYFLPEAPTEMLQNFDEVCLHLPFDRSAVWGKCQLYNFVPKLWIRMLTPVEMFHVLMELSPRGKGTEQGCNHQFVPTVRRL